MSSLKKYKIQEKLGFARPNTHPLSIFLGYHAKKRRKTHTKIRVGAWPKHPLLSLSRIFIFFTLTRPPSASTFVLLKCESYYKGFLNIIKKLKLLLDLVWQCSVPADTRHPPSGLMLATVYHVGPKINHHWVNVVLGYLSCIDNLYLHL